MKIWAFPIIFFAVFACLDVSGQTIDFTVSGNWSQNIPASVLTEAGSDYTSNYTSSSNQVLISHLVRPPGQWRNHIWTIEVHMETISWDNQLQLWIRRLPGGSGATQQCSPDIWGGLDFQLIANTPTYFYNGICAYSDVPIQFELRNLSVLIPADNYSADIVYTITVTRL